VNKPALGRAARGIQVVVLMVVLFAMATRTGLLPGVNY
jgi:hypothetical protein